jgi:DNA polymerase III subunit epsilon
VNFSIVDIETTGSHAAGNRITEIAIFHFDGKKVSKKFSSLINPQEEIPPYISSFTNITNEMVADAPSFEEVADEIYSALDDTIFVAHNVNFDYSFIKYEFERAGITFNRPKLCTVRLSRQIIPGFKSYSLGKLCADLQIQLNDRHRAGGDAKATAKLFQLLFEKDQLKIETALKKNSGEAILPPNLPRNEFDKLPFVPGVYYFHNRDGKILYIGKAKSLRHRVKSHFTIGSDTITRTRLYNQIHSISFECCGNELVASLHESSEIKKYFPPFNRIQKLSENNFGIYRYEDGKSYFRLAIKKVTSSDHPLRNFPSFLEAREFLLEKIKQFELCPKLCGLQIAKEECYDYKAGICHGACCEKEKSKKYNERFEKAVENFYDEEHSYIIIDKGRDSNERAVVMVENGKYLGFGFVQNENAVTDFSFVKEQLQYRRDNRDAQMIIQSFIKRNLVKRVFENKLSMNQD